MVEVPCPEREVAVTSSQALVPSETPKRKRGLPKENSLEPPLKKGKDAKKGETGEGREWEKSVEPPFCLNFTGKFAGEGSKLVVSATETEKRMTLTSEQSSNLFNPVKGDLGLILAGGLATRALEERVERTSTVDLFAQMSNRVATTSICLALALNRALRVDEQMIDQTGQLHHQEAEIETLKVKLATESSQHSALQEEFAVYKSAMSALKADNKALREKCPRSMVTKRLRSRVALSRRWKPIKRAYLEGKNG
ncbi:hypothetical protein AXF42_Ash021368 [Apostasia shenzhenica]|uniref:Uncharacterized protein n=1 Tax=Apostasia shenzhenica TaxID=1088818 RepID=A0A2H9ZY24_9ASPA|nr:hypothetical protein AXF42_Ash021368 [Apostasia shenzhenica]